MPEHVEKSPISFEVHVVRLPKNGMPVTIEATERQRAELARLHDLVSVEAFHAALIVSPWKRNGVRIEGRVTADIVQSCVVSLEPLPARIDEEISATYLPEESKLGREGFGLGGEILIDVDGPDSPETFWGDRIDVGALAEEFFGLALEPYPRKPGAAIGGPLDTAGEETTSSSELRSKLASIFPKT